MERIFKTKVFITIAIVVLSIEIIGITVMIISKGNDNKEVDKIITLGNSYLENGKYKEAVTAFQEALKVDPNNVESYVSLVDAYIGLGDVEKAINTAQGGYVVTKSSKLSGKVKILKEIQSNVEVLSANNLIEDGNTESVESVDTSNMDSMDDTIIATPVLEPTPILEPTQKPSISQSKPTIQVSSAATILKPTKSPVKKENQVMSNKNTEDASIKVEIKLEEEIVEVTETPSNSDPIVATTEEPVQSLEPAGASPNPTPTLVTQVTVEPIETSTPIIDSTKEPEVSSNPTEKPLEQEKPITTETPIITETPIATEKPISTEIPIGAEKPIQTETPIATEKPIQTEIPIGTETPVVGEKLEAIEKPVPSDVPIQNLESVTESLVD